MIIGLTRGAGGIALAFHLADRKRQNEITLLGSNRNLFETNIEKQTLELCNLIKPSKSKKPIYHIHADPSKIWNNDQWKSFWNKFETEFNLENQPFVEVIHKKHDREHRHRIYSLYISATGKTINPSHDYARAEKLARIMELETDENLTPGHHTIAILNFQPDLIDSLVSISEINPGPVASPKERMQAERTGISKEKVAQAVFRSWTISDDGKSFEQALWASNLAIRQGEKAILIVDSSGNVHSLARLLNLASKTSG
ncbi:MAG: hypothetical protein POG74_09310, partial [Acidocella sp.]|nr:hypothetical protein [Acidocella sp.]